MSISLPEFLDPGVTGEEPRAWSWQV